MSVIVPGALWAPVDVGNRPARRKGRGFIAHVAVSESKKLVPGPLNSRPADWTFYFPKEPIDGKHRFFQMIDFDLQCWSSAAGNLTCPAGESQGGVVNPEGEPWTENQMESIAIVYAFGMEHEGWPGQLMPDSRPASRGLGWHRLGIDPWRVPGGEVWSSSRGKICPGDAKIAGMATILARARELRHGSPSPNPEEDVVDQATMEAIADAVWAKALKGQGRTALSQPISAERVLVESRQIGSANGKLVAALAAKDPAQISAADIADAIPEDIAQQVVDELAKRIGVKS